ncbi:MAG TPA: hypothetical protein VG435_14250, partial [Acidimicrobiales bacterium]|nr:hypothetical protein [Acidimicrobiales bacterium]
MMRRRLRRTTAIAAASVVLVFWVVPSSKAGAFLSRLTDAAAPATNAVSLNGEGSDDLEAEIPGWSSELYGTSKKLAMTYAVVGGPEGAFDYSTGLGNFLVSGTPLTTSQLAQIPSSYGSLISAPIMVSALGLAVSWGPAYTLNRSCSSGQTDCQATSKYTGPLDLPANDIADMLLSNTDPSTCGCLSDASILNATDSQLSQGDDASSPTVSDNTPETTHILALLRSDPSESGYYLQEYLSQAAPSEFSHVPGFQPPITPFLQGTSDSQYDVSYDGESAMDGYMTNEGGSVVGHDLQGVLSMLSASGLYRQTYYLPPNIPPLSFTPAYEPAWTGI